MRKVATCFSSDTNYTVVLFFLKKQQQRSARRNPLIKTGKKINKLKSPVQQHSLTFMTVLQKVIGSEGRGSVSFNIKKAHSKIKLSSFLSR